MLADGRYRLLEPLGQGGMAEVWRAWDERLDVERAIKVLAQRHSQSASAGVRTSTGDTAATGATGATGTDTGPAGDTGPLPSCTFGDVAALAATVLSPPLALDTFDLVGTVGPDARSAPSTLWFGQRSGDLVQRTYSNGAPIETQALTIQAPSRIDGVRTYVTGGAFHMLLQVDRYDLRVLDDDGSVVENVRVNPDCEAPFYGLAVVEGFDGFAGPDVVHTCIDIGNVSSLRTLKLDLKATGPGADLARPLIDWTESGFVGKGFRSMTERPGGPAPQLWVGDQADGVEPHRVWLTDWRTTTIGGPADVELAITGAVQGPTVNGPAPVPVSADFDRDGHDDLLLIMPGPGGGEAWVLFDVPSAAAAGAELGRTDMDLIITGGTAFADAIDGAAAVPHPDGFVAVALSGRTGPMTAQVALIPALPAPGPAQTVDSVDDLAAVVLDQPGNSLPFVWDMVAAGDYDGDGCGDLVVHVGGYPYATQIGDGTAYVLSGR